MKSVEQKIYEAYRLGTGVRLTPADVEHLVRLDDAVQTRIVNKALAESGCDMTMAGYVGLLPDDMPTWATMRIRLREEFK